VSKKATYTILFILVVSVLYFVERSVDRSNEEYPKITSNDTQNSSEFETFLPTSTTKVIVPHAYYTLSYHEAFEQAEWVAYELKREELSNLEYERPYFVEDREVPSGSADWRNYKNSGYDRGHLCPAGDRRFSSEAYLETFLTSNISPMNHEFNSGIWNDLEKQVRRWAKIKNGVFVVTGGILSEGLPAIGEEGVAVPDQFFKIVANVENGKWQAIAFLIPNAPSNVSYRNFLVSIDAIENKTGIDFFPNLEDQTESHLEAKIQMGPWF